MENSNQRWSIALLIEILFTVFFTGFFPESWHQDIYLSMYVLMYFTAVVNLEQHKKLMIWLAVVSLVFTGLTRIWHNPIIETISVTLDVAFFTFIVISLIRQIARAKSVTPHVLLEAINAYLLLGIVFTFLVGLTVRLDPHSYNFSSGTIKPHDFMYHGFITLTTTGYGDFIPLKPWSQSLSILIATSGQLYVAIIIALLVGKFSVQSDNE
jgi:voltage-gated potassium channel